MLNELSAALSAVITVALMAASSLAAAETPLTIEQLLAQGWEIAGHASGYLRGGDFCTEAIQSTSPRARPRPLRRVLGKVCRVRLARNPT
jgi:hypothetical protein